MELRVPLEEESSIVLKVSRLRDLDVGAVIELLHPPLGLFDLVLESLLPLLEVRETPN